MVITAAMVTQIALQAERERAQHLPFPSPESDNDWPVGFSVGRPTGLPLGICSLLTDNPHLAGFSVGVYDLHFRLILQIPHRIIDDEPATVPAVRGMSNSCPDQRAVSFNLVIRNGIHEPFTLDQNHRFVVVQVAICFGLRIEDLALRPRLLFRADNRQSEYEGENDPHWFRITHKQTGIAPARSIPATFRVAGKEIRKANVVRKEAVVGDLSTPITRGMDCRKLASAAIQFSWWTEVAVRPQAALAFDQLRSGEDFVCLLCCFTQRGTLKLS
jgi:hypothetical protein